MNSIAPEIRFLYYYYLGTKHGMRDQKVLDLIKELVSEGHSVETSVAAVIERLKNKEDKSDEVG
ncbi:hypothetical protein LCGC14_1596430 [marine sediment metagenome]|uniref:Uncharacterized protein n=1 Tax=marine sediment metagenome TaxID=412755 RepID=A0A0F9ICJ0_9ZZZZ